MIAFFPSMHLPIFLIYSSIVLSFLSKQTVLYEEIETCTPTKLQHYFKHFILYLNLSLYFNSVVVGFDFQIDLENDLIVISLYF